MGTIVIDPVTRIEGHLKIEPQVEDGVVKEAHCSGMMFRGIERILQGRDPRDAQRITQRICGVCPTAHAIASTLALDDAFGIADRIPANGRILRNLILGSNFIQSHILHFYHLAALDFVDVTSAADYLGSDPRLSQVARFIARGALAPYIPRFEGDYRLTPELNRAAVQHYVQALDMRRAAHEMSAIFSGKMPHNMGVFPGGALEHVTVDKIAQFRWRLQRLREFIDQVYIPDVLAVASVYDDYFAVGGGCKRFLSYGCWDQDSQPDLTKRRRLLSHGTIDGTTLEFQSLDPAQITEHVKHSWFRSPSKLPPSRGETEADPHKPDAYSFIKSPRYRDEPYEVGPLARILVSYVKGDSLTQPIVDSVLSQFGADASALFSVLGRHAARAIECKIVADQMADWLLELEPDAPRGALGHWIRIQNGVIENYQAVVPTTWNCSPRDDNDIPGPCEQALEGTTVKDEENPFELVRIVRAFDPCLACSIHVMTGRGRDLGELRVI